MTRAQRRVPHPDDRVADAIGRIALLPPAREQYNLGIQSYTAVASPVTDRLGEGFREAKIGRKR
jgi:hypothetical protein